jgi:DNA-binding MarR family transcriptional regulator
MNKRPHELLTVELIGTVHAIEERLEAAVEPLGLSLAKFRVLGKLVTAREPLPLGTLAEHSACVRSNITQLIDRLEADKLVARADDPKDRRSIRAALTPEGRARHDAAADALEEAERALFSSLTGQQKDQLFQLLGAIRPRL